MGPRRAAPDRVPPATVAHITTLWTGTCSATVELARLAGPRDDQIAAGNRPPVGLPGDPPWRLSEPGVRAAIYHYCLTSGTQFDIYRWVNLRDLAAIWHEMVLPPGLRSEWERVLVVAGLVADGP